MNENLYITHEEVIVRLREWLQSIYHVWNTLYINYELNRVTGIGILKFWIEYMYMWHEGVVAWPREGSQSIRHVWNTLYIKFEVNRVIGTWILKFWNFESNTCTCDMKEWSNELESGRNQFAMCEIPYISNLKSIGSREDGFWNFESNTCTCDMKEWSYDMKK